MQTQDRTDRMHIVINSGAQDRRTTSEQTSNPAAPSSDVAGIGVRSTKVRANANLILEQGRQEPRPLLSDRRSRFSPLGKQRPLLVLQPGRMSDQRLLERAAAVVVTSTCTCAKEPGI